MPAVKIYRHFHAHFVCYFCQCLFWAPEASSSRIQFLETSIRWTKLAALRFSSCRSAQR